MNDKPWLPVMSIAEVNHTLWLIVFSQFDGVFNLKTAAEKIIYSGDFLLCCLLTRAFGEAIL